MVSNNDVATDLVERQSVRDVIRQILRAGQRAQMLSDCAVICPNCAGRPDSPDEYVKPAFFLRGVFRHEWGIKGGRIQGTVSCKADAIRKAWAAAHPEESTDGK